MDIQHSGIYVFDTKEKKAYRVTSGYYSDTNPSFDPEGKSLYFLTNNTFDPVYSDTGDTFIYPNFTRIALVTL